jgi:hypothetical protein
VADFEDGWHPIECQCDDPVCVGAAKRSAEYAQVWAAEVGAHGGKREGAGRKPLAGGRVTRCYALTQQHVDLIEQYRVARGLSSASEALRAMLASAKSRNV